MLSLPPILYQIKKNFSIVLSDYNGNTWSEQKNFQV